MFKPKRTFTITITETNLGLSKWENDKIQSNALLERRSTIVCCSLFAYEVVNRYEEDTVEWQTNDKQFREKKTDDWVSKWLTIVHIWLVRCMVIRLLRTLKFYTHKKPNQQTIHLKWSSWSHLWGNERICVWECTFVCVCDVRLNRCEQLK